MTETALVKYEEPPDVLMRRSSDVAGVCKAIVLKTARKIQGRQYVQVEGWQAIATAHGCVASVRDVAYVPSDGHEPGGYRAIGEVRRIDTGAVIATAEGFVGDDEPTWAKRPVYARRAMASTRSISRVCRSAFAHVVVLIDADLSTTPAEEIPDAEDVEVIHVGPVAVSPSRPVTVTRAASTADEPVMTFGSQKGKTPSQMDDRNLSWYLGVVGENADDPAKAKYRAGNLKLLKALADEKVRRESAAKAAAPSEPVEPEEVPF